MSSMRPKLERVQHREDMTQISTATADQTRPSIVAIGPETLPADTTGGAVYTFRAFVHVLRRQVADEKIDGVTTIEVIDTAATNSSTITRLAFHIRSVVKIVREILFSKHPPVGVVWFMSSGSLKTLSPLIPLLARRCPVAVQTFGGWLGEAIPALRGPHRRLVVAALNRAVIVGAESNRASSAARQIGIANATATGSIRLATPRPPRFEPTHQAPLGKHTQDDGPLRLIYAGRVNRQKGVARAAELVAQSSGRLSLDIFGPTDDGDREEIAALVENPPDGVFFHGTIDQQEVLDHLTDADFAILLSTYPGEGVPGFIIEALSVGTPAILADHLALPELIIDGESGFIEKIGPDWSPDYLLTRLTSLDPHELVTMRHQAFEQSIQHSEGRWMPLILGALGITTESSASSQSEEKRDNDLIQ